jgi:hypothetical protein
MATIRIISDCSSLTLNKLVIEHNKQNTDISNLKTVVDAIKLAVVAHSIPVTTIDTTFSGDTIEVR